MNMLLNPGMAITEIFSGSSLGIPSSFMTIVLVVAAVAIIIGLVLWIGLSCIPSKIAKKKGYGAKLFFWFSIFSAFVPALIVSLVLPKRNAEEIE